MAETHSQGDDKMSEGITVTTEVPVREFLKRVIVKRYGTLTEYAKTSNVSLQYISNILTGGRRIPAWMLSDFGVQHAIQERWIIPANESLRTTVPSEDEQTGLPSQALAASKPRKIVALDWDDEPVIPIEHRLGKEATFLFSAFEKWIKRTIEFYICPNPGGDYLVLWVREKPMAKKDIDPNDDRDLEYGTHQLDLWLAYCSADGIPLAASAFWLIVAVLRLDDSFNYLQDAQFRKAGLLTSKDFQFAHSVATSKRI